MKVIFVLSVFADEHLGGGLLPPQGGGSLANVPVMIVCFVVNRVILL